MDEQTTRRKMLGRFGGAIGVLGAAHAADAAPALTNDAVLYVGLWARFGTVTVATGVDQVHSSGYERLGLGAAFYSLDEDQRDGAQSPWRRRSANGRWFRLDSAGAVDVTCFGGRPGLGFDNTAAMNAAAQYLSESGGGIISLPFVAEWCMNWICLKNNIKVWGCGGQAEADLYCVRPYLMNRPAMQFGDGTKIVRYCGLFNLHMSGTDRTERGVRASSANAPRTLMLMGGVVDFHADNSVFYNGLATVSLIPSPQLPVTTVVFQNCTIRNDLSDEPRARAIYLTRVGKGTEEGYLTSIQWNNVKLNGPASGYAVEVDGTIGGILLEVNGGGSYWDIKPGHGILIKGGSSILAHNLQLDPGVNGGVVIETTERGLRDPTRLIAGTIRHGGQKWRNGDGFEFDLPDEADFYAYRPTIRSPFIRLPIYLATSQNAHAKTKYFDEPADAGPLTLYGTGLAVRDGTVRLTSRKVAQLLACDPSPNPAGQIVHVSNGSADRRLAVSDGAAWRFPDGNIVS